MGMTPKLDCEHCPSRGQGIFCELEAASLKDVSSHKVVNNFKKGQTLFVQGNPPYGVYCVSKGNIKLTKTTPDGKESIIRLATAGDIIGHRSIFTEQHYSATATAIDEATVCFIDKKYIIKLVQAEPTVALSLITKLGKDLGASESKIASFSHKNVREKLAELLLLLKESHGTVVDKKIRLEIKLSREEMASLIGTATETLIRFMSELRDEGLIEQDGKTIYILDEEKLIDFANLQY